jgi:2,3-bisphosphoglycerate-independent phosphoglycerate mutase
MEVRRGDICFRCNFATVDDQFNVVDRRAGRIDSGTHELAQALDGLKVGDVTCVFKESVEHRAALILRGPDLGPDVGDADPHEEGARVLVVEGSDAAGERTAQAVNDFVCRSHESLEDHPVNQARRKAGKPPANIVLPRGAGVAPHLESFEDRYGFTGACIVEVGLIKGLGRYLEMEVVDVPGATGSRETDEGALADAVLAALGRHPFVLCNMKAPDLSGHDGNPKAKAEDIEKLDRLVQRVVEGLQEPACLAVTGDHSTPCSVQDHSGDPVPIVMWGPGVRTDAVKAFGERPAQTGGLGRIRGHDVMSILTSLTARQEKFGA